MSNTVGAPFNPWRGACGFYPPDAVGRDRSLTDGQKRVYERLVRYAGRNGECWPAQETLATELGKSERQIRYDLEKLRCSELISWDGRKAKNGRGNRYTFLWHSIFERQSVAAGSGPEDESSGNSLPVASGSQLPVASTADETGCQSRPAISDTVTGNPLPTNSVREFSTVNKRPVDYANTPTTVGSERPIAQSSRQAENSTPANRTNPSPPRLPVRSGSPPARQLIRPVPQSPGRPEPVWKRSPGMRRVTLAEIEGLFPSSQPA